MREYGRPRGRARWQLLDVLRERREIVRGAPQGRKRVSPRLVRERDRDLRAAGERLEQRPFRAGQVFEAVREDGFAVPGRELACDPLGRIATLELAVPEAEPVEVLAIRRVELRELAVEVTRLEQRGLELGDGCAEGVGKAREPGRTGERLGARVRHDAPQEQRALCRRDDGLVRAVRARK